VARSPRSLLQRLFASIDVLGFDNPRMVMLANSLDLIRERSASSTR
jgi:hypothetical protein